MKIVYVITKASWGGAQRYVYDLACAMQRAGEGVAVVYGTPGTMALRLEEAGARTITLTSMNRDVRLADDLESFRTLTATLKREKPDVVHLNSSKASALGALAARLCGIKKIIFTAHGWAFNEDRPLWQKILIGIAHYVTVLLSHQTICVSEAVRKDASWMFGVQRKLQVIHLGIAEPNFLTKEVARETLVPKLHNGFLIGMLCELHKTKGIYEAVDAFATLAQTVPDAYLVVMGEGGARAELERHINAEQLSGRVILLGHIEHASTYLKAYDLFLFPSRTEALGYALMEAGLAALPTVATNVGGIPELITNNTSGKLVERGNVAAITAALLELEANPAHARSMGETLRAHITSSFGLEKMVEETKECYLS